MGAYQFLAVENVEIVERGGNGFNRVENVEWGLVLRVLHVLRVPVVPVVPGPGAADRRGLRHLPLGWGGREKSDSRIPVLLSIRRYCIM